MVIPPYVVWLLTEIFSTREDISAEKTSALEKALALEKTSACEKTLALERINSGFCHLNRLYRITNKTQGIVVVSPLK
jgi:hypothetical protein